MSKLISRIRGFFSSRTMVGIDKAGNRYYTNIEEIDGTMKERKFVVYKGDEDPTSLPVEWICWLSGQRKKPPTPQEMIDLEAKRERVKLNVAILKEEEKRKSKDGSLRQSISTGKVRAPDLKSFIQQFPGISEDQNREDDGPQTVSDETNGIANRFRSEEPTGSGESFKPGTWQPPT